MIYFYTKNVSTPHEQSNSHITTGSCLSAAMIFDHNGSLVGTAEFTDAKEQNTATLGDASHMQTDQIKKRESNLPCINLTAFTDAERADVFKLFAVSIRLMQARFVTVVSLVINDKVLNVYQTSGASVPAIDAALNADNATFTGEMRCSARQYQHILSLAGICGLEMELTVANSKIL